MSAHFKLIQQDGFTRRVTFPSHPTWHTLAAKIESLYAIPLEKVSVAYIDAENDEVTLSTQEELDDFYQASHQPGQAIKFIVQDMTSTRIQSTALPETPGVNIRDTFGVDIEDDWQRLPPFSGIGSLFAPRASGADSPHAFVEVIESDVGTISNQHEPNIDSESDNTIQSIAGDHFSVPLSKGKERAVADDVSSTRSVLAEHTPAKPPVHVFDHSSGGDAIPALFGSLESDSSTPVPMPTESTPKVTAQAFADTDTNAVNGAQSAPNSPKEIADPPLPSFESTTSSTPPSLCNDVASLLTMLTTVVNTHPELSEGIRNIIHNTASGTYWNIHREALSKAAEELAQTTQEIRTQTEEEAGRKVADALGGIFQALSQTLGTLNSEPTPSASTLGGSSPPPAEQPATTNSTSFWYGASQANVQPPRNRDSDQAPHPAHTPFYNPWMRGRPPVGPPRGGWESWVPPHPFMPPPPPGPPGQRHEFMPGHGPPPPPPPPPRPPLPSRWEPEAPIPWGSTPLNESRAKPTPEESKAKVDAARLRYKAEKERYRQEREERRKERDRKVHTVGGELGQNVQIPPVVGLQENTSTRPSNSKPAAIVSNGRGDYPTIELVSVHRHHTHPGHGPSARRNMFEHGDVKSRTLNRISRRLADMGFTDNAYPELPGKIKGQIPASGVVSKDTEDDIVTTLLEELLAMSPKPPAPSGSNVKDANIPGAWH